MTPHPREIAPLEGRGADSEEDRGADSVEDKVDSADRADSADRGAARGATRR